MTNLQDPSSTNQHGERLATFTADTDDYVLWPAQVVAQSGGVYTDGKQLTRDLKAVGGKIEHNGYTMTLLTRGAFGSGPAEINFKAVR